MIGATPRPEPSIRGGRRPARIALRVALGVALLALVLRNAGLGPVLAAIATADRGLLLVAVALTPAGVLLRTLRWSLLLRGQGASLPWPLLLRALLLGVLVGQVLPTDVAGDATRVLATRRAGTSTRTAVGAVLTDRLLAAWGLLALVVLGLLLGTVSDRLGLPRWSWAVALALLALGTAAVLSLGSLDLPQGGSSSGTVRLWIRAAIETGHAFAARRPPLVAAAALALLGKLVVATQAATLARSLGATVGVVDAMVLAPAVTVAASLPVSLGGVGLREAAWAFAFVRYGETPAAGVALAWLFYALLLLEAAGGGLLALATAGRRRLRRSARGDAAGEMGSGG